MDGSRSTLRTEIKRVGIVGCGLMGSGYTQLCAHHGYQVVVCEVNNGLLKNGLAMIDSRLAGNVTEGQLPEQDKDAILARIKGTTSLKDFSDCDLVIEAATEKMEVKKEIFTELDRICPEGIVLGTNTSVLSVLDIAMATSRPGQVVGIHMNPLAFPIAELVRTLVTSDEAIEIAKKFSESVGKLAFVAKDVPGFVVNRLITPLMMNAIRMMEANIASKEEIDKVFKALGWPMGPLATADMIGLDTLLLGTTAMYEESKEAKFAPPVLLKKMVAASWLGCKTGKGFYDYYK